MVEYVSTGYSVYLGKHKLIPNKKVVEVVACIRCHYKGGCLDIGFIPDNEPLPLNCVEPNNTAFRPISEYYYYLDILRNEKPIYIHIYETDPYHHGIRTGKEKIGEGEPTSLNFPN